MSLRLRIRRFVSLGAVLAGLLNVLQIVAYDLRGHTAPAWVVFLIIGLTCGWCACGICILGLLGKDHGSPVSNIPTR